MIRAALFDAEPALLAGLDSLLRGRPDLTAVGRAGDERALWALVYRTAPDVVVLGEPRDSDAFGLALRLRRRHPAARVLLYVRAPGTDAIVAATLAGAHGVIDKTADLGELLHLVRVVGRGERVLPVVTPALQRHAAARLEPVDRAILAMGLAGTPERDIAGVAGLRRGELAARMAAIVGSLTSPRGAEPPRPSSLALPGEPA